MSHRGPKTVFLVASVVICAAAASVALKAADTAKSAAKPAEEPGDVEQLLKERLQVLQEIVDFQERAYRQGEAAFPSVLAAHEAVLSAKLELAKMPRDRIAILEGLLKSARELEKVTAELVKTREVPRVDYLKAVAQRLRVQADLARERSVKGE